MPLQFLGKVLNDDKPRRGAGLIGVGEGFEHEKALAMCPSRGLSLSRGSLETTSRGTLNSVLKQAGLKQ